MLGKKKTKTARNRTKTGTKTRAPLPARPSRMKLWLWGWKDRHARAARRWGLVAAVVLVACATGAVALRTMERHVLARKAAGPTEFRLEMADRPSWMPLSLARHLVRELTPPRSGIYDPDLPAKVHRLAEDNPWVGKVAKVLRRASDDPNVAILELHAEYRKPIAFVQTVYGAREFLSEDGTHLPRHQVPHWVTRVTRQDGSKRQVCFIDPLAVPPGVRAWPIHYVKISGARHTDPPGYGRKWPGEDMAAGLKMVALVADRSYVNQIAVADIRNFAGRMRQEGEPHLRFYARVDSGNATDIRFGRFPHTGGDHNVAPDRKLSYMDAYVARHNGKLAGLHSYIDLRFDELHVSVY